MKIINKILFIFSVLLLFSCTKEEASPEESGTRGVMYVEILEKKGDAIDKIETVRFLVFEDPYVFPKLELNELFNVPAVSTGEDEVSKFEITLEVNRKPDGVNNKMVVAIINEPPAMISQLNQLSDYNELTNLELNFTDFLMDNHREFQSGSMMPMTGVVWTNKVYATPQEAKADPAQMEVLRALACVEVYIRKETGVNFDLGIGTNIHLNNTYDKEYFVRNEAGSNVFGKIQTITSGFITKDWAASAASTIPDRSPAANGLFLCSFYTPERTCSAPGNADKLTLDITVSSSQGNSRSIVETLDLFTLNNVNTIINTIERNNIYRVIITVTEKDLLITATVSPWNEENIIVEF